MLLTPRLEAPHEAPRRGGGRAWPNRGSITGIVLQINIKSGGAHRLVAEEWRGALASHGTSFQGQGRQWIFRRVGVVMHEAYRVRGRSCGRHNPCGR